MIALLVLSIIMNVGLLVAVSIMVQRNLQLVDKLEELGEQVDESLDILNESYSKIDRATKLEVLSDEPVIVGVLKDVKKARDAVLIVANKLVIFDQDEEGKD